MTGPNYGLEISVERPIFNITTPTTAGLQIQIEGQICDESDNAGESCGECSTERGKAFDTWVGGGGLMYYSCNRGNACGRLQCPRTGNFAPLYNIYLYRRSFVSVLSGRTLLKGVGSEISKTIDPVNDPNFVRKTFIDVLNDPELTQQETPWFYPNSTKWMPLSWDSPLIMPEFNEEQGILSQAPLYLSTDINDENVGYFSAYSSENLNTQSLSFDFVEDEFEEKQLAGFITDLNFPGVTLLKKGKFSFELYVKAKNRVTEILLRAKVFKLDSSGNETELTGNFTDYSEPIYAESNVFPPDINQESYKTVVITDYITEDLQLNTSDRLIFKIYGIMKKRDGQTQEPENKLEFSFGQDKSTIYYQKFGTIFSLAPCFAGDADELTGQNSNAVKINREVDSSGVEIFTIYTSPVNCNLITCCPTEQ